MFKPMTAVLAGVGFLMAASGAQAATITFTDTLPLQDVELGGTVSVAQFDPSLGTLTGVTWSLTGAIASILGIQNDGPNTVQGSAFTSVDFDFDSAVLSLGASPDFNVFATTGLVSLGSGETVLFPVTASTTITGSEAVSASFIGLSLVDVLYFTTTGFGGSGFGGDITISQATDAGIQFSITYEYDEVSEVPLPAAAPLMAAGLGLFGLYGARRRKAA